MCISVGSLPSATFCGSSNYMVGNTDLALLQCVDTLPVPPYSPSMLLCPAQPSRWVVLWEALGADQKVGREGNWYLFPWLPPASCGLTMASFLYLKPQHL